jgi:hypothetical protein
MKYTIEIDTSTFKKGQVLHSIARILESEAARLHLWFDSDGMRCCHKTMEIDGEIVGKAAMIIEED